LRRRRKCLHICSSATREVGFEFFEELMYLKVHCDILTNSTKRLSLSRPQRLSQSHPVVVDDRQDVILIQWLVVVATVPQEEIKI
jgi:hypothetical protein